MSSSHQCEARVTLEHAEVHRVHFFRPSFFQILQAFPYSIKTERQLPGCGKEVDRKRRGRWRLGGRNQLIMLSTHENVPINRGGCTVVVLLSRAQHSMRGMEGRT